MPKEQKWIRQKNITITAAAYTKITTAQTIRRMRSFRITIEQETRREKWTKMHWEAMGPLSNCHLPIRERPRDVDTKLSVEQCIDLTLSILTGMSHGPYKVRWSLKPHCRSMTQHRLTHAKGEPRISTHRRNGVDREGLGESSKVPDINSTLQATREHPLTTANAPAHGYWIAREKDNERRGPETPIHSE